MTNQFDSLFYDAGQRYAGGTGLDPASFAALCKAHGVVESGLEPTAYRLEPGNRASRGLMQVLDTTARALGFMGTLGNDSTRTGGLYDPAVAIPLAAQLVRQNLQASGGDVDVAIAAYNEGIGRAKEDGASGRRWRTTDPDYVSNVRGAFLDAVGDFGAVVDPAGNGGSDVTDGGGTAVPTWVWLVGAALLGVAALVSFLR